MTRARFARWSVNRRLALLALLLGAGALIAGGPSGTGRVSIDTRELAALVEGELDHVTPVELADWIVAGRQDFRLVDLRAEGEYAAYHVPGAERIPITGLEAAGLPRNEKIVLYSAAGIHSAQAWFLLKARRYPAVYILLGGLGQWQEQVLFPVRPADDATEEERAAFGRAAELARHFGGAPREAAAPGAAAPPIAIAPLPRPITPPAMPPGAGGGARRKKEGC